MHIARTCHHIMQTCEELRTHFEMHSGEKTNKYKKGKYPPDSQADPRYYIGFNYACLTDTTTMDITSIMIKNNVLNPPHPVEKAY